MFGQLPQGVSSISAQVFHSSQLFLSCALASSSEATRSERFIGPLRCSDQNQRRPGGEPRDFIDAPDYPLPRQDGEVSEVLVNRRTQPRSAHLEGHAGQSFPASNATMVCSPVCSIFSLTVLLGFPDFRNRAVCYAIS